MSRDARPARRKHPTPSPWVNDNTTSAPCGIARYSSGPTRVTKVVGRSERVAGECAKDAFSDLAFDPDAVVAALKGMRNRGDLPGRARGPGQGDGRGLSRRRKRRRVPARKHGFGVGRVAAGAACRSNVWGRLGLQGMGVLIRPRILERGGGMLPVFFLQKTAAQKPRGLGAWQRAGSDFKVVPGKDGLFDLQQRADQEHLELGRGSGRCRLAGGIELESSPQGVRGAGRVVQLGAKNPQHQLAAGFPAGLPGKVLRGLLGRRVQVLAEQQLGQGVERLWPVRIGVSRRPQAT